MKIPVKYRIMAIVPLVISVMLMAVGGHDLRINLFMGNGSVGRSSIMLNTFFIAAGLWHFASSIMWIFGSKYSYNFIYTSAMAIFLPPFIYSMNELNKRWTPDMLEIIILLVFAMYPVMLFAISFRKKTREWAAAAGPKIRYMFNPVILLIFALVMLCGPVYIEIINARGRYVTYQIVPQGITASSQQKDYAAANAVNTYDSYYAGWSPWANPSGINEWIELKLPDGAVTCAIDIYPGANHNGDRRMFARYNRVRSGYILFTDGTKHLFSLKDSPVEQRIEFEPRTTGSVRIVITDIYKGSESDTLYIACINVLKKVELFE